jgi:hypothetical protein
VGPTDLTLSSPVSGVGVKTGNWSTLRQIRQVVRRRHAGFNVNHTTIVRIAAGAERAGQIKTSDLRLPQLGVRCPATRATGPPVRGVKKGSRFVSISGYALDAPGSLSTENFDEYQNDHRDSSYACTCPMIFYFGMRDGFAIHGTLPISSKLLNRFLALSEFAVATLEKIGPQCSNLLCAKRSSR